MKHPKFHRDFGLESYSNWNPIQNTSIAVFLEWQRLYDLFWYELPESESETREIVERQMNDLHHELKRREFFWVVRYA